MLLLSINMVAGSRLANDDSDYVESEKTTDLGFAQPTSDDASRLDLIRLLSGSTAIIQGE